jgi:uncharacterized membrane protein
MKIKITPKQIRTNVVTGILVLLPVVTTAYVFYKFFVMVDSALPSFVHALLPQFPERWVPGIGLILLLLLSYFVGLAAKNYVGKIIIDTGNALIARIPMLNKLYLGVQQILDAMVAQKKRAFERAVLVEYPKENSWCIAFVTADTSGEIPRKTGRELVSLFVPTTPNPTSGFLLFVPRDQVIDLEMSIETAIKLVMSAGMISAENINETDHLYALPDRFKNFKWTNIFKRGEPGEPQTKDRS